MEKIVDLLNRISTLYTIPQWAVNGAAIVICIILVISPFVARYLMRPKYNKFREMFLFKVLWQWKYKKGDIISLWCYCPKCQGMLICDDENCRTTATLQDKITFFVCDACGGNEIGRVVGGDRRYALSLVRRDIWRHIKDGTYNEVSKATKEALELYQKLSQERAAKEKEEGVNEATEENESIVTSECADTAQKAQEAQEEAQSDLTNTQEAMKTPLVDEKTADATVPNSPKEGQ